MQGNQDSGRASAAFDGCFYDRPLQMAILFSGSWGVRALAGARIGFFRRSELIDSLVSKFNAHRYEAKRGYNSDRLESGETLQTVRMAGGSIL